MGYGQLTTEAAVCLADVIASFQRNRDTQTRALLVLFASTNPDGCTAMGIRTLAERAGVSKGQAEFLLKKLERDGVLEVVGTSRPSRGGGEYTIRRFSWVSKSSQTPRLNKPRFSQTPRLNKPPFSQTHQSTQSTQRGRAGVRLPPTPPTESNWHGRETEGGEDDCPTTMTIARPPGWREPATAT